MTAPSEMIRNRLKQKGQKFFCNDNIFGTAYIKRGALVQFGRLNIKYPGCAVCSPSACLLADKSERIGFIHQPELAVEVFCCRGIHEHPAC